MAWQDRYFQRFYTGVPGWEDGTVVFHRLCQTYIPAAGRILEVGAGPTNPTSDFLATLGRLCGIDPDPKALNNTALSETAVLVDDRYPFEDQSFDAAVSNYVVEHVADPRAHLREIHRVLKPGARYVFRTPNHYHYVALISSVTPYWFHQLVANRARNQAWKPDPTPTVYAMNTERAGRTLAEGYAFEVERMDLIEKEPSYALASRAMFLAGVAYERAVNYGEALRALRANLFVVLRRY